MLVLFIQQSPLSLCRKKTKDVNKLMQLKQLNNVIKLPTMGFHMMIHADEWSSKHSTEDEDTTEVR